MSGHYYVTGRTELKKNYFSINSDFYLDDPLLTFTSTEVDLAFAHVLCKCATRHMYANVSCCKWFR